MDASAAAQCKVRSARTGGAEHCACLGVDPDRLGEGRPAISGGHVKGIARLGRASKVDQVQQPGFIDGGRRFQTPIRNTPDNDSFIGTDSCRSDDQEENGAQMHGLIFAVAGKTARLFRAPFRVLYCSKTPSYLLASANRALTKSQFTTFWKAFRYSGRRFWYFK